MANQTVTLFSPANGLPWECPEDAAEHWLAEGYKKNPTTKTPAEVKADVKADARH